MCTELGVYTIPKCIEGVWIVPLYSWYHASFDTEPDVPGALPVQKVGHWLLSDCMPTCGAATVGHINSCCLRSGRAQPRMGTSSALKVSQGISLLHWNQQTIGPDTLMSLCSKTSYLATQLRTAAACTSSLSICT